MRWFRNWIGRMAHEYQKDLEPVLAVMSHSAPAVHVYKITNGYLVHKTQGGRYVEDMNVVYCATPLAVAREFVGAEALDKLGMTPKVAADANQTLAQPVNTV